MLTLLSTKQKPVSQDTQSVTQCTNRAHTPFCYWRDEAKEKVCDCCNWESAFMGGVGHLWCYPEEVREPLRQALERRGIVPED